MTLPDEQVADLLYFLMERAKLSGVIVMTQLERIETSVATIRDSALPALKARVDTRSSELKTQIADLQKQVADLQNAPPTNPDDPRLAAVADSLETLSADVSSFAADAAPVA